MIVARRSVCACAGKGALRLCAAPATAVAPSTTASLSSDGGVFTSLLLHHKRPFSTDEAQSNRAAFKAMPVDPKLLEYIERIGVGISKRSKPRKRSKQQKRYSRKHDTTVLDTKEEVDFFRQRLGNIQTDRKSRKSRPTSPSDARASRSSFLPPPPFASTPDNNQGVYSFHSALRFEIVVCFCTDYLYRFHVFRKQM